MSQFVEAQTKVLHMEDIIAALIELGIPREHVEVHKLPVALSGYDGRVQHQAEVVVRKCHTGARYGDIGATRYKDGVKDKYFRFISDDTDCRPSGQGGVDRKWGAGRGGFINHVAGRAGVLSAERKLKKLGFRSRRVERRDAHGAMEGMRLVATRN
jgi:hypothetical protein